MAGLLKISRAMFDGADPLWPPPGQLHTPGEAWLDVLNMAHGSGKFPGSERELAARWAWSRKKVAAFLAYLTKLERISRSDEKVPGRGGGTMYQIEKPNKKAPRKDAPADEPKLRAEYDLLHVVWKDHPNDSKSEGFKCYCATRRRGVEYETLRAATRRYYRFTKKERTFGTTKMLRSSTFFGVHERWRSSFVAKPDRARPQLGRLTDE